VAAAVCITFAPLHEEKGPFDNDQGWLRFQSTEPNGLRAVFANRALLAAHFGVKFSWI